MLTRGGFWHSYFPMEPARTNAPGYARVSVVRNIPQTWAIARPNSSWQPNAAPLYLLNGGYPQVSPIRGGVTELTPLRPRKEMDPSDSTTWQRAYRFTQQ